MFPPLAEPMEVLQHTNTVVLPVLVFAQTSMFSKSCSQSDLLFNTVSKSITSLIVFNSVIIQVPLWFAI